MQGELVGVLCLGYVRLQLSDDEVAATERLRFQEFISAGRRFEVISILKS